MVVEKILGNIGDAGNAGEGKAVVSVSVAWFETNKRILYKTASDGEAIGLRLSEPLRDGDILFADDDKVVVAEIEPCELIRIEVASMVEMGRACFELGNRHLPLSISDTCVKVVYDRQTFDHMAKSGFACVVEKGKFAGPAGCGHSHHHRHGHDD